MNDAERFLQLARAAVTGNPAASLALSVIEGFIGMVAEAYAREIREVHVASPGVIVEDHRTPGLGVVLEDHRKPRATEGK